MNRWDDKDERGRGGGDKEGVKGMAGMVAVGLKKVRVTGTRG